MRKELVSQNVEQRVGMKEEDSLIIVRLHFSLTERQKEHDINEIEKVFEVNRYYVCGCTGFFSAGWLWRRRRHYLGYDDGQQL